MFQGVVHKNARMLISKWIPKMPDRVYVGCVGNFTIPATLRLNGYHGEISACDISLYSSSLGCYLAGKPLSISVKQKDFMWLEEYLVDAESTCAAISVMMDMIQHVKRDNQYRVKMWDAFANGFAQLHQETISKLRKFKGSIGAIEYYPEDVFDFLEKAKPGGLVMMFPPTYKGGYERIYKYIDGIFEWDRPSYTIIDGFGDLFCAAKMYDGFRLLFSEYTNEELAGDLGEPIAIANRGLTKDIYIWTNLPVEPALIRRGIASSECRYERHDGKERIEADSDVSIKQLDGKEAMYLRKVYLSNRVNPAPAGFDIGVFIDGKLFSILGFSNPNRPSVSGIKIQDGVYLMYDMPVSIEPVARGAKLNLYIALSKEVQAVLREKYLVEVCNLVTTAFSKNPVSMKYRGLFTLLKRKETEGGYALNYSAQMGKWTAREGLALWEKCHGSGKRK